MDVIRVVDVPIGTCADEAQRLLNAPCAENRYLLIQVLQLPDGVTRAIYRLLAKALDRNPETRQLLGNVDRHEARGLELIKANPGMSIRQLEDMFEKEGVNRKRNWISERRRKLFAKVSTTSKE